MRRRRPRQCARRRPADAVRGGRRWHRGVEVDVGEQLQVGAARVPRDGAGAGAGAGAECVVLAGRMRAALRIAHRHEARLQRLAAAGAFRLQVRRRGHKAQRFDALVTVQVVRVERRVQAVGERVEKHTLQPLELRPKLGCCRLIGRLDSGQLLDHILRRNVQVFISS